MSENKNILRKFYLSDDSIKNAIEIHHRKLYSWASQIDYTFDSNPRGIMESTVVLNLTTKPSAVGAVSEFMEESKILFSENNIFENNILILGAPGSGKTTLLKRLIYSIFERDEYALLRMPIFVRARDIKGSIWSHLSEILGLSEIFTNIDETKERIISILNNKEFVVFVDGLDEYNGENSVFYDDINILSRSVILGKIILTSRVSNFINIINKSIKTIELAPLNLVQIRDLVQMNFPGDEFYNEFISSKYSNFMRTPLVIVQLIQIYKRYGELPNNNLSIYKKIINLYLEDWDLRRNVVRKSSFSTLSIDKQYAVLSHLAYELLVKNNIIPYSSETMLKALREIANNMNLGIEDYPLLLIELTENSGILIKESYASYCFSHLALQEFLAAGYLIRSPFNSVEIDFDKIPNVIALTVLMSSNPFEYLKLLLNKLDINESNIISLDIFFSRLIFEIDFSLHKQEILGLIRDSIKKYKPLNETVFNRISNKLLTAYNKQ